MKMKRFLISMVMLSSLMLAACSFRFTTEIEVDGSGVFRVKLTATEEDISLIEVEEGDTIENSVQEEYGDDGMQKACEELAQDGDFPDDATAEFSDYGSDISCEIAMTFDDLDELIEIYEEMFDGMTGKVRMNTDGDLSYAIELDMDDFPSSDDIGYGDLENTWIVTAPGTIEDHNADDKSGGTLTWNLDESGIEDIEFDSVPAGLFAIFGGDISVFWILVFVSLCLCVVVLVVVGGGAGFYFYNKKRKEAAEA